ncbi:protein phosphatase 1 regulatory subunit 21-like [Centruroides vittatus]|uniref:protein phosphatase 1 regulatory subunit 21-like n=1 Tax=Centruroides vittatus TaxID=120091 RepID=UPI00350FD07E
MGETSDISVKYQKLAAEYSKLRAQVSVLKKAISEEQGRSSELKEALKEKDQTVRKLEQEVECLNFRNVQLMKRVSVLQSEFEGISDKSSKNKHKAVVPSLDEDVLNLELRNKIEENEKLYIQVTSAEIEHKRIVDDLSSQLEEIRAERLKETRELNETIAKYKTKIDRLTKERAKLEVELKNYEKEVKEIRIQEETCQEDLKIVETDLRKKKESAEQIIKQKLPFIDTKITTVNSTNIPIVSQKQCCKLSKVLKEMSFLVTDAIHFLCELHKNIEGRIKLVDRDLLNNGLLNKFENHLKEGSIHLKNVDKEYQKFTKTMLDEQLFLIKGTSLSDVSLSFSVYVSYLEKLLPYFLLSLNSESKTKGSILKLEEIHEKLYDLTMKLISCFNSLKNSLQLFVEMESTEHYCNSPYLIRRIFNILCNLQSLFEEMKKIFSAKIMTEQHLPILTSEIKASDSLVLTSMISVINALKKITQKTTENMEILSNGIPCKARGYLDTINSNSGKMQYKPVVLDLRQRGVKFMEILQEDKKSTIPYETALKNRDILTTYADNKDELMKKLSVTNEKLKKTEQEKEHWMLEYQLLQMKQGKMVDGIDNTTDNKDIHHLFKAKKDQLLGELQIADSKAVAFHTENIFLNQKLNLAKQSYQKLEKDYADCQYNLSQLQDELKTRVTMYENQLSTMSDHLAELNEKITEQSEELEIMKYTGGKKTKK